MKSTLQEDRCTFFAIYRSFFLRIRSVSKKRCRENQNTFVIIIIIIIIIIFINCIWVVTRWQWLFYMYTNMKKKVTRKFKSGGLHERHVVATWKLGNHLSIRL